MYLLHICAFILFWLNVNTNEGETNMGATDDDDHREIRSPGGRQGEDTGRYRQRRRTRAAIVAATMGLLKSGMTPSVSDIAEAAEVSRRTVYLHFPTLEQLLIDAKLGLLSESAIDEAIEAADPGGDVEARVTAMISTIGAMARQTLPLGRSLIRLTVDTADKREPGVPRRGYRRIGWIEKALAPLRDRIEPGEFERLVSALAMVIGWEALVVLEDVRGLSSDEQLATSLWAARALIRAALDKTTRLQIA
jgi:AcrR family transcriptional regulator